MNRRLSLSNRTKQPVSDIVTARRFVARLPDNIVTQLFSRICVECYHADIQHKARVGKQYCLNIITTLYHFM
jgi:hypothetical protein